MAQWGYCYRCCGWKVTSPLTKAEFRSRETFYLCSRLTPGPWCSDTTAPSLTTLFYLLARHPRDAEKIHQELTTVDAQDVKAVATLPHLNGAINEAMRLLPAVLTFVTRVSPAEGLKVEGTFIPGNIKIAAPRYSIGRRKSQPFLLEFTPHE